MEECACLCGVGSSRECRCQEGQGPAERAAAEGKPTPTEKPVEAEVEGKRAPAEKPVEAEAEGKRAPGEKPPEAEAEGKRAPAEKPVEAEAEGKPAPAEKPVEAEAEGKPAPAEKPVEAEAEGKPAPAEKPVEAEVEGKRAPGEKPLEAEAEGKPAPAEKPVEAEAEGKRAPGEKPLEAEAEGKPGPAEKPVEAEAEGKRAPGEKPVEAEAEGKPAPAEKPLEAEAEGKPAPAEKPLEAEAASWCCVVSGGIASPMPPPHCSLLDLPVEMLVEILALLPGTNLPSLALACTKFYHILHTDSIWRRRCREEYGVREKLQNLKTIGMSYREVYTKLLHPYRNILGLWQPDQDYGTLLNVAVDGICITGWTYGPCLNTHEDGPMPFKPSFRIRLTEGKSAAVECYVDGFYSRPHSRLMQTQEDRFSLQWIKRDQRTDSPTRLRGEGELVLPQEDSQLYAWVTYRRLYLPPGHPGDLMRPGLFQFKCEMYRRKKIAMLSFHGKYARVTNIRGELICTLEIHLRRRIQPQDGEIFRDFNELSRVVREIDEQVLREQQQQQEDGTEESEGHGWQSPAQPSVGESGAAASEEQPVPFVLPAGVRTMDENYPRTCRMCFYGVDSVTLGVFSRRRRRGPNPGVFILFDENHFGFLWLERKYFILFSRVQNTFQNVEAPSPQAFLDIL